MFPSTFNVFLCFYRPGSITTKIYIREWEWFYAITLQQIAICNPSTDWLSWINKYIIKPTNRQRHIISILIWNTIRTCMLWTMWLQMTRTVSNFWFLYLLSFLCYLPVETNSSWLTLWNTFVTEHKIPSFFYVSFGHNFPVETN